VREGTDRATQEIATKYDRAKMLENIMMLLGGSVGRVLLQDELGPHSLTSIYRVHNENEEVVVNFYPGRTAPLAASMVFPLHRARPHISQGHRSAIRFIV
jgi:hypothetical protein